MFGNPRIVQAFAAGFAFFISGLLCLFLSTAGKKDRSARSFAFALFTIAIWGLFGFFFEITPADKLDLARTIRIISVIFIAILTISMGSFSLIFYQENVGAAPRAYRFGFLVSFTAAIMLILLLLSDLSKFSNFIVKDVIVGSNGALDPIPGPFFHFLYIYFFFGNLYTGFILWMARTGNTPLIKNQVKWMLISIMTGLLAGGSRFMTWYGINGSPAIASLAAPIFGIGFFYAIVKHHLFNIRVIATEIFTFSIWAFLFLLIVFSDTTSQRIVNTVLFLATSILGTFLIRGALREVSQKEELGKANTTLEKLNRNLEEIVRERTKELNRSKLHTDAIIENLVLGLVEYTNDFTVVRVNRAAEELLGFDRTITLGKKITGDDVRNEKLSSLAEIIHLDSVKESSFTNQESRGSISELSVAHPIPRDLQIITFPVASEEVRGGKATKQYIKIIRDITREKLIDQNKSDFIKIATHQLRTPLSAIKWVFNLALEAKSAPLSKDQLDALKDGYQVNEHMISLINDLLNVVYIEDGRFGYEFKYGDILKTVSDVAINLKTTANWKRISLETHFPEHPIPVFAFDAGRISIALTNIIENAINYTHADGSVAVSVLQENDLVKILVKDSGIGVPREELSKLLVTKFFRSVKALRAQTDGSGLGLYIANNIVKSHKGRIIIDSEENKGTTVTITIPITLAAGDEPRYTPTQTTYGS